MTTAHPSALLAGGIDQQIDTAVKPLADVVEAIVFYAVPLGPVDLPLIILWLAIASVFITVYLRFQPITGIRTSLGIIRGRFTRKTDPGQVSSFQALATELSGTVGLGNIAGVAMAIALGGPGAALWIVVFGFFAMSMKMAEATLGVKYRHIRPDGTVSGGPMYYLRDGLADIGWPRLGKFLAAFYCVTTVVGTLGAAAIFQSNQATAILVDTTGGPAGPLGDKMWLIGIGFAVATGIVVIGGIRSIANLTSALVPLMTLAYLASACIILIVNAEAIPHAFMLIITGAFTGSGVAGGALGVIIIGLQRSLFSNAAGVGTAATAHSASKTTKPATEGFVALWEPFVDSIVVCTLTAVVITVTGAYQGDSGDGVELTATAFRSVADWFPVVLTIIAMLFAYSSLLSYCYYGQKALGFLTGDSPIGERVFQAAWLAAVIIGAPISFDAMMRLADSTFFLMSVPNILGIYFLSKIVRMEILRYRTGRAVGTIDAVPADLQVGMGNHQPTAEQVQAARQARQAKRDRLARVRSGFRSARRARASRQTRRVPAPQPMHSTTVETAEAEEPR